MLVAPIRAGTHDFVIGSRVRGKREPGSMSWHQVLAGRLAGWLISLLYGVRYTDMCAFRAISREALAAARDARNDYGWNIEMQMQAARAGLRILEVPVPYRRRAGGRSKVAGTVGGSLRAGSRIILTVARIALAGAKRSDAGAWLAYIERKAPAKELSGRRTWDFQDPRPAVTFL